MTASVPCACLCSPFSIFSLVDSFGQVRHIMPCEGTRWNMFELGHFIWGRLGALCTFVWLIFHFLPCALVWLDTLCRGMWGCLMKHVWVGLFHFMVIVSNFLSCDCLDELWMFVWPIFHLLPSALVRLDVSCHAVWGHLMKRVQVGSFHFREVV